MSLDKEIDKRIAKRASVVAKVSKRVWNCNRLILDTRVKVYQAYVLSILIYASQSWTIYARQENRVDSFHPRCVRRLFGIT